MKSVQSSGPYRLVGYSFGAAVAFEMGLQLGEQLAGLVLLDGSPTYVATQVQVHADRLQTQEEKEAIFLCGFVVQIVSSDYMKVGGNFYLALD